MRYWIMDKDDTPQGFPLQRLLRRICDVAGTNSSTCNLSKVRGYGSTVHTLEERLDAEPEVDIALSFLDKLSEGTEEWFYDLEARLPGTDICFGLHDSTALFVEGDPAFVDNVVAAFVSFRLAT